MHVESVHFRSLGTSTCPLPIALLENLGTAKPLTHLFGLRFEKVFPSELKRREHPASWTRMLPPLQAASADDARERQVHQEDRIRYRRPPRWRTAPRSVSSSLPCPQWPNVPSRGEKIRRLKDGTVAPSSANLGRPNRSRHRATDAGN